MWYCSRSPTIVVRGRPSFCLRIPFVVGLPRDHLLAKERRVKPERFLLKDGHCLRDHALAVCRLADRRLTEGFEATSLPTLVQMVDNGLGTTLLCRCRLASGHKPRYPTVAHQRSGTKDRSRLAPRHRAPQ
jgi:DNA-binding transcriptional LysR family regulator